MKQARKVIKNQEKEKKQSKKIKNVTTNEDNEMTKLIKITVVVIVIIVLFFVITYFATNKKTSEEEKETEIQYSEILVGEMWNYSGTYFVLAGSDDDQFMSLYDYYLGVYQDSNSDINYYTVNLDSVFNEKYVSDTSNLNTDNHSEIRFKGTTLLKLQDGKVVEYYEGKDAITSYLESLI